MKLKFLTLLAPAVLLSACGTYNGGLDSVYQPVVSRSQFALDLSTSGYDLAPGEAQRLGGWLSALKVGYGDRVAIDDPAGSGAVREQVAAQAAKYGLLVADDAPVTRGALAASTVRVVITRTTASVPNCPDYSRSYVPDYKESTSSNFGCAVNSNLAAMVAHPEDLVRGQSAGAVTDPTTAANAVEALRKSAPVAGAGGGSGGGSSSGGSSAAASGSSGGTQ